MKGWSIFREGKDHFFWVRRLSLTLFCMGYFYPLISGGTHHNFQSTHPITFKYPPKVRIMDKHNAVFLQLGKLSYPYRIGLSIFLLMIFSYKNSTSVQSQYEWVIIEIAYNCPKIHWLLLTFNFQAPQFFLFCVSHYYTQFLMYTASLDSFDTPPVCRPPTAPSFITSTGMLYCTYVRITSRGESHT